MIFLALLAGGFFRSLQMTSINTLSYADVPPAMLSRATSLTSMAQQLSQTAGVATAALLLHTVLTLRGGTTLAAVDFYPVFVGIAMISLLSVPFFLKMSPDAGAEVSGRAQCADRGTDKMRRLNSRQRGAVVGRLRSGGGSGGRRGRCGPGVRHGCRSR